MNGSLLAAIVYSSLGLFVLGMGWRMWRWGRLPVPLMVPLTPGPATKAGVARRLAGEVFEFRSLFRAAPGLWVVAWLFHASLVLLLIGHVGGLAAPEFSRRVLGMNPADFNLLSHRAGVAVGVLSGGTLLYLLWRRVVSAPLRYLSTAADYFLLGLLLSIVATGLAMRFAGAFEIDAARKFVSGLLALRVPTEPPHPLFTTHVLLVSALLVYAPCSKLVHMIGIFFNPALTQTNTPRERRHVNPLGNASA